MIIVGLFALILLIPNQSFALNPSEVTWQLIVMSSEPACTIYHFQMIDKYHEITQKYLDLYQLENSNYEPACMTVEKYHSEYEKPRDLDLIVLVYDNDLGQSSLHQYNTGGIYLHQGDDLSTNHSVIICDCPNFYYSDPVWILSHELSHFVLNYLGYDLDIVETEIHEADERYDHCVEVSYDSSCSDVKTKIIGYRHNWTVMAPYEPAIGNLEARVSAPR